MFPKYLEVNGKEQLVDSKEDFLEFLAQYDIDEQDAKELLEVDDDTLQQQYEDKVGSYDGLLGDDYYQFIEGLEGIFQELNDEVLESLKGDGRKKVNQRAAVARRLESIVSNLDALIH